MDRLFVISSDWSEQYNDDLFLIRRELQRTARKKSGFRASRERLYGSEREKRAAAAYKNNNPSWRLELCQELPRAKRKKRRDETNRSP